MVARSNPIIDLGRELLCYFTVFLEGYDGVEFQGEEYRDNSIGNPIEERLIPRVLFQWHATWHVQGADL